MSRSHYLAGLNSEQRKQLERRLHDVQNGRCFICGQPIDLILHRGQVDVDHIDPLLEDGVDAEINFALTHAACNRSKSASNLQVARRLVQFERLQEAAQTKGKRGADLGDVLKSYGGGTAGLTLQINNGSVEFSLPQVGDNTIHRAPVLHDRLSGMNTFVAEFPLEYLHHDDRINPRSIGANLRGLIEEFHDKRPQLHMTLGWWAPEDNGSGKLQVFDGQHKAVAQILLGVRRLPVRVFLKPDTNVLLQANTNAGGKLRQVAFSSAVMRHLGSTLYLERVNQYRRMRGLAEDDYSFSEQDLVKFFLGQRREMERYIIDAQRDAVTHEPDNTLLEFVEWSGKGANRPLAYNTIERSFFQFFLYKKALNTPIDQGIEQGNNPRQLEREQLVQIMKMFAETFFVNQWDPEIGGRRIENRIKGGETIPEGHLRAWRISRLEVAANILRWLRLVVANYFAYTGRLVYEGNQLLHTRLPDELWDRMRNFLKSLAGLPCWVDLSFSTTVFGPKQNRDYWEKVFETGKSPSGVQILAQPLDLKIMIQGRNQEVVNL